MTPVSSRSSVGDISASQRPVVRAACLNCRSAKRRCDGVAPVCGPCQSRGIEAGGCEFVSSKRGGPRYKGVKGSEAAKVKADKDKAKEVAKAKPKLQLDGETPARSSYMTSDTASTPSHHSGSPPAHRTDSRTSFGTHWPLQQGSGSRTSSQQQSPEVGSNASQSAYNSPYVASTPGMQVPMTMMNQAQTPLFNGSFAFAPDHSQQHSQRSSFTQQQQPMQPLHSTHISPHQAFLPLDGQFLASPMSQPNGNDQGGSLSFANMEMWQKLQEGYTRS